jgi:benzylsuccinate CoA-transferase BbsF subunit
MASPSSDDNAALPCADLRVLELSQGIAAPNCGRHLGALGAEVVKVESPAHLDITRQYVARWLQDEPRGPADVDSSPLVDEFIADKASLGLDLKRDDGMALLRRLVAVADVFVVNLSQKAIAGLGLRYEDLVDLRPDLVYLSLPAFGESDTAYRDYRSWGSNLAALVGIDHLTGWPDRPPSAISGIALTDHLSANHATVAVLAAILERDLTGKGCHIDFSQFESAMSALGPTLLEYTANGRSPSRQGNASDYASPHGVYPARGTEQWVAIVCPDDGAWRALCAVAGSEQFSSDDRWATTDARVAGRGELDAAVAEWSARFTARDLAYRLQAAGVPASPVYDAPGLLVDPQLEARGWFTTAPSARFGTGMFERFPAVLSRTPAHHLRAGAALGEDSASVLHRWLDMDEAEVDELVAAGAVYEAQELGHVRRRPYTRWFRYFAPTLDWGGDDG